MSKKPLTLSVLLVTTLVVGWSLSTLRPSRAENEAAPKQASAPVGSIDRTVLPIKEPTYPPITEVDARQAKPRPRFDLRPPKGAPNVVVVLIDDMGFGQSSAFGGPIQMPTAERLAKNGLRFNRFHTTALCSPTRIALLTGRNHHSCNMGSITELATAFPGMTGQRPQNIAPLAEMMRLNGYNTAAFGKSHETAAWEVSESGPFDRWPTFSGFEKFYGFLHGETNQYAPDIYDGVTKVEPPKDKNYHFMTDMTDQAVRWMRTQQTITPDKPFFMYFAPGATHAPHHAPKEWIAKYKGKFDQGWDKLREETLARQIALGVVPKGTKLAPKPAAIKDWDRLTDAERRLFARQMEVFAGFGEYCDAEIGRLVRSIEDLGELDNTLILYVLGDNGASAEGGMVGLLNEETYFNGVPEKVEDVLERIDDLGGPLCYNHYAAGWAVAGDTPFSWTKQVAASFGGTRNPLVVHWPQGIKSKGEVRSQFHHVIDVAPTVLEACGLPQPKEVNGVRQRPIEGVSMVYAFDDAAAEDRHVTQYFEIFCNRAIYHDGWTALTVHREPWAYTPKTTLQNDVWELYHVDEDFSQSTDLAKKHPEKLKELQELFLKEAVKYNVLPLDDRGVERFDPGQAGRPSLMAGRKKLTLFEGMPSLESETFLNLKNRSFSITADVELKESTSGVIVCQGGRFSGWSLYVHDGKPRFEYNWLNLERYKVESSLAPPAGKATIRFEFTYDGGRPGAGGTGVLFVDGKKTGEARFTHTMANMIGETVDIGKDEATPVSNDYAERDNRFTGRIVQITVEVK